MLFRLYQSQICDFSMTVDDLVMVKHLSRYVERLKSCFSLKKMSICVTLGNQMTWIIVNTTSQPALTMLLRYCVLVWQLIIYHGFGLLWTRASRTGITCKRGSAAVVRTSCCSYRKHQILRLSRAETTEPINTKF